MWQNNERRTINKRLTKPKSGTASGGESGRPVAGRFHGVPPDGATRGGARRTELQYNVRYVHSLESKTLVHRPGTHRVYAPGFVHASTFVPIVLSFPLFLRFFLPSAPVPHSIHSRSFIQVFIFTGLMRVMPLDHRNERAWEKGGKRCGG